MGNGTGNGGKLHQNQTVRAAGRIGVGTAVATIAVQVLDVPSGLREPVAGLIILATNELAYAAGLVWKKLLAKLEG